MWRLVLPVFLFGSLLFVTFQTGENRKSVYEPTDLIGIGALHKIRVVGKVRDLSKINSGDSFYFEFQLHDEKGSHVRTIYHGFKPELLQDGVQAMVDGDWDGSTLLASSVLTQCPSKYEPKSDDKSPEPTIVEQENL